MTLTKSDIINGIYNSTDLKLHQATKTVDNLLELIKKTIGSGEDILISGFVGNCGTSIGKSVTY